MATNVDEIKKVIAMAANNTNRSAEKIEIVAVTKTVPVPRIQEAMALGISNLGENRVQELESKYDEVGAEAKWHFIGHLQTNKVKDIVDKVVLIHSLDRWSLARELNKRARAIDRKIPVLVQVNIAEEDSKFGLKREETIPFIKKVQALDYLDIQGLMTMAPLVDDPEEVRPIFRSLRELAVEIESLDLNGVEMNYLSMGMTNDYQIAVEEGANLVRIGSGIFGKRS